MAKSTLVRDNTGRKKRKGVHAKTKNSKLKGSKNYVKMYKGQGQN